MWDNLLDSLRRFRGILILLVSLVVFEAVGFNFGWINATEVVALVPASLVLYLCARWSLRNARGRRFAIFFGIRHIMVLVVVCAVLLQLTRTLGWSLFWLLFIALPPLLILGAWMFLTSGSRTQQEGLVSVLSMAASRGLPLAPAVAAYAVLCRGFYRAQVEALARQLEAGVALPSALDRLPSVLPADSSALARAGWDTNQLGPALERASETRRVLGRKNPSILRVLAYPAFVLLVTAQFLSFFSYFVRPKFRAILTDFGDVLPNGMPEPGRTANLILDRITEVAFMPFVFVGGAINEVFRALGLNANPAIGVVIVFILLQLALLIGSIVLLVWIVRMLLWTIGFQAGDRTVYDRPGRLIPRWLRFSPRSQHAAVVLRGLALGVEAGLPMNDVLDRLACSELLVRVRRAVRWVQADIRAGRPWIGSLVKRRLIRPADAAVIASAERVGNLAWSLRDRADALDRRRLIRLRALALILHPLCVIALGLLVLVLAIVYFMPLVAMISGLVENAL